MKRIIATSIFLIMATGVFAGGPWTQPKGVGYYKISEWWIQFDQHYTDAGLLDPNVTTKIFNTFFYAEYGLTDRVTGIFNPTIFSRNLMNNLVSGTTGDVLVPGEAVNFLGDTDLGIKYGLNKPGSRTPVALTLMFGIPTGRTAAGALENLQTGDGEFNQYLRLDVGRGYGLGEKASGYTSGYLGFNNRTKNFSEEIRYGIETGLGLADQRLWLTGRFYGVESLKNGATAETVTSTSIFANNTEFTSVEVEASYYITKRFGISGSFATPVRGEIIAAAPSYSIGIFLDTSKN